MKILFVTPYLPSPPQFGAQRRLDGLMRGLARTHEVSLLSFAKPGEASEAQIQACRDYATEIVTVPYDMLGVDRKEKRLLQLRSLVSQHSFERLLIRRPEFQTELDAMVSKGNYDVVQVEFAQMGTYDLRRNDKHVPKFVLDEHNIEYELTRRTAEAPGSLARRLYNAANWRKLRREEHSAWWRFDGVAVTSGRDQELLQADLPGVRSTVVPNAVDVSAFRPGNAPRDPATLMFLGAMNYYPNTDGVLHFLDETLPLIRARCPLCRFQVVGMDPPASVLSRVSEWVQVTGLVPDPLPYLERATIVVVPLRIGGGTRFKIVEAMAMGKAIVSTRLGAEGIDVAHGKHVLFADSPAEFAAHVERLLADPELAQRLGRQARQLCEERYSWQSAVAKLDSFYNELGAGQLSVAAPRASLSYSLALS